MTAADAGNGRRRRSSDARIRAVGPRLSLLRLPRPSSIAGGLCGSSSGGTRRDGRKPGERGSSRTSTVAPPVGSARSTGTGRPSSSGDALQPPSEQSPKPTTGEDAMAQPPPRPTTFGARGRRLAHQAAVPADPGSLRLRKMQREHPPCDGVQLSTRPGPGVVTRHPYVHADSPRLTLSLPRAAARSEQGSSSRPRSVR